MVVEGQKPSLPLERAAQNREGRCFALCGRLCPSYWPGGIRAPPGERNAVLARLWPDVAE